jgi:hypothetical protein
MIGLCQEGKSSPDALREERGCEFFSAFSASCWPLGGGFCSRIDKPNKPDGIMELSRVYWCQYRVWQQRSLRKSWSSSLAATRTLERWFSG